MKSVFISLRCGEIHGWSVGSRYLFVLFIEYCNEIAMQLFRLVRLLNLKHFKPESVWIMKSKGQPERQSLIVESKIYGFLI